MIRGTTPTFTLRLKNISGSPCQIDLSEAKNIYFTISQGCNTITKTGEDISLVDGHTVLVYLNQEESISLREKMKAEIQLNWTYIDNEGNTKRAATKVCEIALEKQLIQRVIE